MRNGDISNRTAPTVLIRVEDTLFKPTDKRILGVKYKTEYELQENTFALITRLALFTDYRIKLVCDPSNFKTYKKVLEGYDFPFAHLQLHLEQTITNFLNNGIYYCYIDDDLDRIGRVNHKSCYTVADFTNLVL